MNKRTVVNVGLTALLVFAAAVATFKIQDSLAENGLIEMPFDQKKWITLKHPLTMKLPPLNGLTEGQVQQILGPPDDSSTVNGRKIYTYRCSGILATSFTPIEVIFIDGEVSSSGFSQGQALSPLNRNESDRNDSAKAGSEQLAPMNFEYQVKH